jgi:hypothetical protein
LYYVNVDNIFDAYYYLTKEDISIKALSLISQEKTHILYPFVCYTAIVLKEITKDKIIFKHIDIYDEVITEVIVNIK